MKPGENVNNSYKNSESCMFVVGILNKFSGPSQFDFRYTGTSMVTLLTLDESVTVSLTKGEKKLFRVPVPKETREKFDSFKTRVVSLTGSCSVFVSKSNKNPNADDSDDVLQFIRRNDISFNTLMRETEIDTDDLRDFVYIAVIADSYSVVDVYPFFEDLDKYETTEKLRADNLVNRVI